MGEFYEGAQTFGYGVSCDIRPTNSRIMRQLHYDRDNNALVESFILHQNTKEYRFFWAGAIAGGNPFRAGSRNDAMPYSQSSICIEGDDPCGPENHR
jgi:hypothetical protein